MRYGYSVQLAAAIQQGDAQHLGVRLGLVCLEKSFPVAKVASRLGVSRQTVYNWFTGKTDPAHGPFSDAARRLLKEIE